MSRISMLSFSSFYIKRKILNHFNEISFNFTTHPLMVNDVLREDMKMQSIDE